uniref:Uncharacterized protein n=1 Tax=Pyricularia oryzae (strain P131) TaxID=1143193 RepID=L7J4K8_PYRO1
MPWITQKVVDSWLGAVEGGHGHRGPHPHDTVDLVSQLELDAEVSIAFIDNIANRY